MNRLPLDWEWVFEVTSVEKVTDGDTYWLYLDVGFRQHQLTEIRLHGWDTPELFRPRSDFERAEARRARDEATRWFNSHGMSCTVVCETAKDPDSFGRWLGDVYCIEPNTGQSLDHLGEHLFGLGLATQWPARWRDVHDTQSQSQPPAGG